jgi:hypothetical protein
MPAAGLNIGRASDVVAGGTSPHRPPGPGAVATRAPIHLGAPYFSDPASVAADPEPMSTLLMLADSPARSPFEARPPAAFSKLNTVAVFMEPLLPTPRHQRSGDVPRRVDADDKLLTHDVNLNHLPSLLGCSDPVRR